MADEGITEDNTEQLIGAANTKAAVKITQATIIVERDAKINTPVLTGALRRSLVRELDTTPASITGTVGTNLEYGPFVELGTSRMAAQPYLVPALSKNMARIRRLFTS